MFDIWANPHCRYCKGSGVRVFWTCRCVTEQLRIHVVSSEYTIKDYTPGHPEVVYDNEPAPAIKSKEK